MINNISHNTISGSVQEIVQAYEAFGLTGCQIYSIIFSFTFIVILLAILFYNLIKTFINKSCIGCSRLRNCEKSIMDIRKILSVNKYIDGASIKEILEQICKLRKDIVEHGRTNN